MCAAESYHARAIRRSIGPIQKECRSSGSLNNKSNMTSPSNTYAISMDAAVEAARRWSSRRSHHRKIDRSKSNPALSQFESADRILLRAQRLQSKLSASSQAAAPALVTESYSTSSGKSLDKPIPQVNEMFLERVINRTRDFQFTAFLEQAIYVAHAVCRMTTQLGNGRESYGTGFLVTPHLLLTNHHVLPTIETALASAAEFGYQQDRWGNIARPRRLSLDPTRFFINDKNLDFALVAVDSVNRDRNTPWVWCPMIKDLGKIITLEHINIIQHPRGEVKQVVIRENRLIDFFEGKDIVLHYEADTEPGSSGSPVFNDQWEVVALHHSGVPRTDIKGNILKVDGKVWERGDDPYDIEWIANEGIRTSKIVHAIEQYSLQGEAHDLQQEFLAAKPPDPEPSDTRLSRSSTSRTSAPSDVPSSDSTARLMNSERIITSLHSRNNIMSDDQPNQPSSILRLTIPIHLSISLGETIVGQAPKPTALQASTARTSPTAEPSRTDTSDAFEKIEPAPDYGQRPGYDPQFLGFEVPFPKLTVGTRPKAYAVPGESGDKKYLLNYYHYSLIFNRERYLAFVAGVNYDPTAKYQHPRDKGGDKWFYDPRVTPEEELQAGEELYAANPLDRGHLVRRADAAWGATAQEAKLANDDTFHFTNCSPQHEITNQGKRGQAPLGLVLWGELEEYVASQGKKSSQRLSIFNGPIFRTNDRVYREVKIPKQFWKVIVFENASGKPAAAAFKLTQASLIRGLEEAFEFEEYQAVQLSVKQLEAETGLNFGKIAAWDMLEDESALESLAPGTNVVVLSQLKDIVLGA
jgi:endonuclease G, mitochondrial